MSGVPAPVFGLALLDSLNPSAVAITLYLLLSGGSFVPRVISYAAGIFSANLLLGSALMLGLGSVAGLFDGPVAYGAQAFVGVALLAYAILAPDRPKKEKKERRLRSLGPGAVFLLGMTITVVEFSTALPYLGAVAILTNAGLTAAQWLPILAAYNLVFVAPPLLLLGAYRAFGAHLRPAFERWGERLRDARRCSGSSASLASCSSRIACATSGSSGSSRSRVCHRDVSRPRPSAGSCKEVWAIPVLWRSVFIPSKTREVQHSGRP